MDCKDRILSNNYLDILTDFPLPPNAEITSDICYVNLGDLYNIIYINRMGLPVLPQNLYDYHNMPKLFGLMQLLGGAGPGEGDAPQPSLVPLFDPSSLISSGILQAQRPPLSLSGQGVVLCFIDTGIDYTNPAFRDDNGDSRILAIWDQTIQDGEPPKGFLFGTEYTKDQINEALRAEDPYSVVPSRDENGHGSAIAGVAAGSRVDGGRTYLGAAPDADIVVVKLKECKPYLREYYLIPDNVPAYAEQDIMLAAQYSDSFAVLFQRPVVICLGIGTNMGDHAGSTSLAGYLNALAAKRSRAVVVCGGNEGNAAHHYSARLDGSQNVNNRYKDVEIRVAENNIGFFLEFWGSIPDAFNVTIRSPGGETIPPIRLGIQQSITYGFIYERTQISIDSVLVEPNSGEELIIFRVQEPTPGIWHFRISPIGEVHNGTFHMWLPITEFLSADTYFLEPDPFTTLTEPSMASGVITVSTYNDENNSFYIESGRGFARNGRIRPDFAAPGVNVSTIYGKQTGSSMAAAITAGGVAQFMQWAVVERKSPQLESKEVKTYFIRGATRLPDLTYPNRDWGYGRLNLIGTFDVLAGV